jgi:hypothetical protein
MSTIREIIVTRIEEDLIGPHSSDEILQNKPSDIYLTGILWPSRTEISLTEDDGGTGESEDDDIAPGLSIAGQQRPSTMGVSFATSKIRGIATIRINFSFATYESVITETESGKSRLWQRKEHSGVKDIKIDSSKNSYIDLNVESKNNSLSTSLHLRVLDNSDRFLCTVTLLNRTTINDEDQIFQEEATMFQTGLRVSTLDETEFEGLPDLRQPIDEDEQSTRLLYRNSINYAFGHQCSATWSISHSSSDQITTQWIPKARVPNFKQNGHPVFEKLVLNSSLNAKNLANAASHDLFIILNDLYVAYDDWLSIQKNESLKLDPKYSSIAGIHLDKCQEVLNRIGIGIEYLKRDENALHAFRLANLAMHIQHEWKVQADPGLTDLSWRPFQIGFILLTLESVCNGDSDFRDTLDLLWFPTGGGKTEAYLAIIALGSWYRRLTKSKSDSSGNFAIMRYTLRLLTAQQFERASAVILACEAIRKDRVQGHSFSESKIAEFSIGLWVGKDATPNNFDDALANRGNEYLATAEQISVCYSCNSKLNWNYDSVSRTVRPMCRNANCLLGLTFGTWPVMTIDDDIYRQIPTVIIGTVDKFAQVPLRIETADMFGFQSSSGTELIIQDELHLISGPLGTIVGIYETAFDWLLTRNGIRPKIIGSTATIRRASSQVRALFDRSSCQFPPAGLNSEDSGFAIVDDKSPGRLYLGITTAGRSAKFSLQATAGSLLQSGNATEHSDLSVLDGYTTLLMYFNALRELGGAIVQVLDDVPDSMALYANLRSEKLREIDAPKELTSRVSQKEIVSILGDLSRPANTEGAVDVVLATNMVSVGVDVPRLGLMLVNGQPKTRAEYIQSTSRVGRSKFPGLIVCVFNSMKARDRSHFETFTSMHQSLYRDVEATSVTPFASRARDRALRAVLISMIRHSDASQKNVPNFKSLDMNNLRVIIAEIERRARNIDASIVSQISREIDEALDEWSSREVRKYLDNSIKGIRTSLLQYAEDYARRVASGNFGGSAWPIMNTMRSVEASTPFRLKERIFRNIPAKKDSSIVDAGDQTNFPWRRPNDSQ